MKKRAQTLSPKRRLRVTEASGNMAKVLREAAQGPIVIHSRGIDRVVVLAIEDYERLTANQPSPGAGGAEFLRRVEALKQRHGGGVSDFEPARLEFVPAEPFSRRRAGGG